MSQEGLSALDMLLAGKTQAGKPSGGHAPQTLRAHALSIVIMSPEEDRRREIAAAMNALPPQNVKECPAYPEGDFLENLLREDYDVIMIDLDGNPSHALYLLETICSRSNATVMVFSESTDSDLLVQCMRAGAREFLRLPVEQAALEPAMMRAFARRPADRPAKASQGKMFVFASVKGGSGATTVACNFAVVLAQMAAAKSQRCLFVDFSLPLGDASILLGVSSMYSTLNALQNAERLDSNFLSSLLSKHSSGLDVLAAPDRYIGIDSSEDARTRLIAVARQAYDYVVLDMGSTLDPLSRTLFREATISYLVTQVSVTELRNSNRIISEFFPVGTRRPEVVLNRYNPRSAGIDDESIKKALTMEPQWKIPGDYIAVRDSISMKNSVALTKSPISKVIHQMVEDAAGLSGTAQGSQKAGILRLFSKQTK
ncbi:MAG: AAA family ATPase [Acidobacteria bacterium]|jgi:pilus assembly protein CpaE|nr:AAA family ATPase [Acidobacteriota bacterium]